MSKIGRARDGTRASSGGEREGGDGASERSERSKQTSRQRGGVEKRSGEGERAKRSFYVKHISYHPN